MDEFDDITSVANIMEYENGDMSDKKTIQFFSGLIKTGLAWTFQGSYGRMAMHLINRGLLNDQGDILIDLDDLPALLS